MVPWLSRRVSLSYKTHAIINFDENSYMNKIFLLIGIIFFVVISGLYLTKRGNVEKAPVPISSTPSPSPASCTALTLNSPSSNQKISSPLSVTVTVDNTNTDCHWTVFEAQAGSMKLLDEEGTVIGEGVLTTEEDWMTDQPVQYKGTITFTKTPMGKKLELQIHEENPSGKPDSKILTYPFIY